MNKIEKINELDMKLLEKHNENFLSIILNRLDNLINLINDEDFLLIYLNPKSSSHNAIYEKILYYRLKGENSKIKSLIHNEKHSVLMYLLFNQDFDKFEKEIKNAYLRKLKNFK